MGMMASGGLTYTDSNEDTPIDLDVSNDVDYTEDSSQGLELMMII